MQCYHPIPAAQEAVGTRPILWPELGTANMQLRCDKCIGCLEHRAQLWAHRCTHEAKTWTKNTFITLTYDDDHLPKEGALAPKDLQTFIKRVRKHANSRRSNIDSDRRANIRFIACGEYGDENGRPHYHAILFNCGFNDQKKVGSDLYQSARLDQLWGKGQARFGPADGAAANYIAKYTLKRLVTLYRSSLMAPENQDDWGQIHPESDQDYWKRLARDSLRSRSEQPCSEGLATRPKEFLRMSLKPAIGMQWLSKYSEDLRKGYITDGQGKKRPIPRQYEKALKKQGNALLDEIKQTKYEAARENSSDKNERERLRAAEILHLQKREKQQRKI